MGVIERHRPSLSCSSEGATALILRVAVTCDDTACMVLRSWVDGVRDRWPDSVTDWVPSKRSVLLQYDLLRCNLAMCAEEILAIGNRVLADVKLTSGQNRESPAHSWSIPVCYDGACAIDRSRLEDVLAMEWEQVIRMHLTSIYRVVAVGFSPGFAYMDGLPEELRLPRKSVPLLRVPKGSVAIAERQCGIYPVASPGGWHVLGRTSMDLFSPNRSEPSLLRVGDRVKFIRQLGTSGESPL
jgi:KipI family sensor histidine kinase inhibitor